MSRTQNILYLSHRIPYPPNKGDKIRSYHVLRYLSERYNVYLGAFIDDPRDWKYVEDVQRLCRKCKFVSLQSRTATLRGLKGLLTGEALTLPYYRDKKMSEWVNTCIEEQSIDAAYIFSSSMAQYLDNVSPGCVRRVVDFVDIDSDKWTQYSKSKGWPTSWVYKREGKRLQAYEYEVASESDAVVFVSKPEAELFSSRFSQLKNIQYIDNGVDWDYFSPRPERDSPYSADSRVMVFTGAMDYWANVDAVEWFANSVYPKIRQQVVHAEFVIVGARPTEAVKRLEKIPGVYVTGSVGDIRPYIEHAHLSVAPLRIARGVQNKVLEAMAMARPVLASPQALEGIEYPVGIDLQQAVSSEQFAEMAIPFLQSRRAALSAREWVKRRYDWNANLSLLSEMLTPSESDESLYIA